MSETLAVPSKTSFRSFSFAAIPFFKIGAVILAVLLGCGVYFGYKDWQGRKAGEILRGPANGAVMVYLDRRADLHSLSVLSEDIRKTRAPGTYLSALQAWQAAGMAPAPVDTDKTSWVYELEKAEQTKVLSLLASYGVTLSDIKVLESKLSKISPQLSDAEEAMLNTLTEPAALSDLALARHSTLRKLFMKLNELGASDTGLRKVQMWHPSL